MRFLILCAAILAHLPLRAQNPGDIGVVPPEVLPPDAPAEKGGEKAKAPPVPLNAQISQHILKLADAERETRMNFMRIVIDDVVRLCELDEAQRERLELAAKG